MTEDQLFELRQSLIDGLIEVVEAHRVDVGGGLSASDVMGALEWVKLQVYLEAMGDSLLNNTTLNLG